MGEQSKESVNLQYHLYKWFMKAWSHIACDWLTFLTNIIDHKKHTDFISLTCKLYTYHKVNLVSPILRV